MDENAQDRLRGLLGFLQGMTGKPDYEPLATLSGEQLKEWKEIDRLNTEGNLMLKEASARADLFWVKVRRALGEDGDRDSLRVEDNMVVGSRRVQPPAPEGLPSLGEEESA
jgi:hypothetical protein